VTLVWRGSRGLAENDERFLQDATNCDLLLFAVLLAIGFGARASVFEYVMERDDAPERRGLDDLTKRLMLCFFGLALRESS